MNANSLGIKYFILITTIAIAMAAILAGYVATLLVAMPMAVCLIVCIVCRLDVAIISWLITYVFSSTLKRMFFLSPDENYFGQYVPLGLALACSIVISIKGIHARHREGLDFTDKALLAFILALAAGIIFSQTLSLDAKVIMLAFAVTPYSIFYAFRAAGKDPGFLPGFCKAMVIFGLIAAVYGLPQFIWGPTWIDRHWAESSGDFSVNAQTVLSAITSGAVMRPYSLFSDHFTYGYFLVAAFIALLAGEWPHQTVAKILVGLILLIALGTALTRTAWIALLMALILIALFRHVQISSKLTPFAVLGLYILLTFSIGFAYERWFPRQDLDEGHIGQAFTLGTLAVRRNADDAFYAGLKQFTLLGDFGASGGAYWLKAKFSGDLKKEVASRDFDDAHNMLINLLSQAGIPGLLAFLLFLGKVLSTKMDNFRSAVLIAACCGLVIGGVTGSGTIFAGFLISWCALASSRLSHDGMPHIPSQKHKPWLLA